MHPVDHLFIFLLFVVQPIYGYVEARYLDARARAGQPFDRARFYQQTTAIEWSMFAALGIAWVMLDRPVGDLGFVPAGGRGFWVGLLVLVIMTGLLVYAWRQASVATDEEKRAQLRPLGRLVRYCPHTSSELKQFFGISITAGIVEETVYRGFVIWYLAALMPVWAAVIVSSIAFGLAHSYQGTNGATRAGLVGLAFGIFYIGTGSIWLPIIAHAILDVLQGATIYECLREDGSRPEPQAA